MKASQKCGREKLYNPHRGHIHRGSKDICRIQFPHYLNVFDAKIRV